MIDDTELMDALEAKSRRQRERRDFFRNMGAMAAFGGLAAAGFATRAAAQEVTDADILNFALNLEYLEANFYHFAIFGTPIPLSQTGGTVGTFGAATGGRMVNFTDKAVAKYAREIADDEIAHVEFLRGALGDSKVAQPQIDVGTTPTGAFSSAARAAGLIGPGESFDPYANDENFLLGAFIFEDVGVTAYKGASPLLTNRTYLEAAAGILAVEAYHASIIRTTLYQKGLDTPALITDVGKISDARDSLDGSSDDDQGIAPVGPASNIVPTDDHGLAYSRTTGNVLNIVYLNPAAVSSGGFFPLGVNGSIKTSTANGPVTTPTPQAG